MDVTPLIKPGQQVIQSYSGGTFRINNDVYEGAVIVQPESVSAWPLRASKGNVSDLTFEDFQPVIALSKDVDVVLFGCGKVMQFLQPALQQDLRAQGLHIEIMDTGAACRTYNVLMAEGRRVAAALLPV